MSFARFVMEAHPDPVDQGSNIGEMARAMQEAVIRNRKPDQVCVNGVWETEDCEDCGLEIGLLRLEATGSVRCVHCQGIKEKKGARR